MKMHNIFMLLILIPCAVYAAGRESARVGVSRMPTAAAKISPKVAPKQTDAVSPVAPLPDVPVDEPDEPDEPIPDTPKSQTGCRDAYRQCMDDFCLLDESEGGRCACSDNINQSKSLILEIQKIQADADKLYTEGVEREKLGAKASLVFGDSEKAKKASKRSGINFADWLNSDMDSTDVLDADDDIGNNLYEMAREYCASELDSCTDKAEMEEALYSRSVVADCKSFSGYLADQKRNVESNKRTAESAVRAARLEMLGTTNKYNRGECLLAYRSCIADKGGCGVNFENCLDADLLKRRSNACENILDQCMSVRDDVKKDWEAESVSVIEEAAKYADKNSRAMCLAKIQNCLEENCSVSTDSACLVDVNVAAGICPVITDCNKKIPGIQSVINDKLKYLQNKFCQNDVDACLKEKCGVDFTKQECVGKKASEIATLCPQDLFPSCKNTTQFEVILQSAMLQMDYQLLQGCINQFSEKLATVCGLDMDCLPPDTTLDGVYELPKDSQDLEKLRLSVRDNSTKRVDEFFKQFEQDKTISACRDVQSGGNQVNGKKSMGDNVFNTAKMIAYVGAENRAMRNFESKIAELSRSQDIEKARQTCLDTYKVESPDKSSKNYSYVRSVAFEPDLRNCHVCRVQQVCETGGESKATSALKAAAGGLSGGAGIGTMFSAGWGTAIGGAVGAVGAGIIGAISGGKEEFCQEIESCEDVNM